MKRTTPFIFLIFSLLGCNSIEKKAEKLINEKMFNTLYDYQSYEVIKTSINEVFTSIKSDSIRIGLAKEYVLNKDLHEKEKMTDYDFTKKKNQLALRIFVASSDSIYDSPQGYYVTQKFRCKNKIGFSDIHTYKYLINRKANRIIEEYEINENEYTIDDLITGMSLLGETLLSYKIQNNEFLNENKNKDGIITTQDGLQYKIIVEGNGITPSANSKVKIKYKAALIDGTEFLSSDSGSELTPFRVNQVIKGLSEALTMMPIGSKWKIFIPANLAYEEAEIGKIKPFSTLIYEVELISIEE